MPTDKKDKRQTYKQNQTRLNLVCEKHTEKEAARNRFEVKSEIQQL